jgi:hypothetical protein
MKNPTPLRILDAHARRLANVTRAEWARHSSTFRERFRMRAQLQLAGRERLVRTDTSYRRSA